MEELDYQYHKDEEDQLDTTSVRSDMMSLNRIEEDIVQQLSDSLDFIDSAIADGHLGKRGQDGAEKLLDGIESSNSEAFHTESTSPGNSDSTADDDLSLSLPVKDTSISDKLETETSCQNSSDEVHMELTASILPATDLKESSNTVVTPCVKEPLLSSPLKTKYEDILNLENAIALATVGIQNMQSSKLVDDTKIENFAESTNQEEKKHILGVEASQEKENQPNDAESQEKDGSDIVQNFNEAEDKSAQNVNIDPLQYCARYENIDSQQTDTNETITSTEGFDAENDVTDDQKTDISEAGTNSEGDSGLFTQIEQSDTEKCTQTKVLHINDCCTQTDPVIIIEVDRAFKTGSMDQGTGTDDLAPYIVDIRPVTIQHAAAPLQNYYSGAVQDGPSTFPIKRKRGRPRKNPCSVDVKGDFPIATKNVTGKRLYVKRKLVELHPQAKDLPQLTVKLTRLKDVKKINYVENHDDDTDELVKDIKVETVDIDYKQTLQEAEPKKKRGRPRRIKLSSKEIKEDMLKKIRFVEISRAFAVTNNSVLPTTEPVQDKGTNNSLEEDKDTAEKEQISDEEYVPDLGTPTASDEDTDCGIERCPPKKYRKSHLTRQIRTDSEQTEDENDMDLTKMLGGSDLLEVPQQTSPDGEKILTCVICNKVFKGEEHFLRHLGTHTGQRPHTCHLCGEGFVKKAYLNRHLRTHTDELPYSCDHCGKRYKSEPGLSGHLKTHMGNDFNFECPQCGKKFRQKMNLLTHIKTHDKNRPKPYKCSYCDAAFYKRDHLVRHRYKHMIEQEGVEHPYMCEKCGKKFIRKDNFQEHAKVHTSERPFACLLCDKTFKTGSDLSGHTRSHMDKNVKCDICGAKFRHQKGLNVHLKVHSDERPHVCEYCGTSFKHDYSLKIHVRIHTGDLPYSCKTCGQRFRQYSNWQSHMLSHTDEKPLTCEYCGKQFKGQKHLKRHINTHTGEKIYNCEICSKTFYRQACKRKHMLIHTGQRPYICQVCGKAFRQSSNLSVHMMIHDNSKPYKCDVCDVSFRRPAHLRRHRLMHTGEKPYACHICGKRFTRPVCLPNHLKRHELNGDQPLAPSDNEEDEPQAGPCISPKSRPTATVTSEEMDIVVDGHHHATADTDTRGQHLAVQAHHPLYYTIPFQPVPHLQWEAP